MGTTSNRERAGLLREVPAVHPARKTADESAPITASEMITIPPDVADARWGVDALGKAVCRRGYALVGLGVAALLGVIAVATRRA